MELEWELQQVARLLKKRAKELVFMAERSRRTCDAARRIIRRWDAERN
jgi:hypothetical protein